MPIRHRQQAGDRARRSFLLFNNSARTRFKAEAAPAASFSREETFGWDRPKRSVMQRLPRLASIYIELASRGLDVAQGACSERIHI